MKTSNYIYTIVPKDASYPNKSMMKIIKQYNISENCIYIYEESSHYKINKNLDLLINNLQSNDRLIIMTISDLGWNSNKILNTINTILDKSSLIFIADNNLELSKKDITLVELITSILDFEDSLKSKKNTAYKETLQKNKKNRGRKSGQKTKSIFDKHKQKIIRLYKQHVPITKILKKLQTDDPALLNTSSQALGQYIKRINYKRMKTYQVSTDKQYGTAYLNKVKSTTTKKK